MEDLSDLDRNAVIERRTREQLKVNEDAVFEEFDLINKKDDIAHFDREKIYHALIRLKALGISPKDLQ